MLYISIKYSVDFNVGIFTFNEFNHISSCRAPYPLYPDWPVVQVRQQQREVLALRRASTRGCGHVSTPTRGYYATQLRAAHAHIRVRAVGRT